MKKLKITFFLVSLLLAFAGCKKSDDSTNGKTDPCANITCLNGGTCANGICNCPPGYTGSDCGTAKTPVSVTVTKIVLSTYPLSSWDLSTGPDVFLSLNQGTSASDIQTSAIAYDMNGTAISFVTNFPVSITTPSVNWTVGVWDYDTPDPDDFMGGIYFIPNDYKAGFPATIHLNSGSIDMTLYVTWNF